MQPLPGTPDIEIGWWLARAWWGRGLATEAARVALGDGFARVGLGRIVAIAQPANTASIRIMLKLGMRHEGMMKPRGTPVVLYSVEMPRLEIIDQSFTVTVFTSVYCCRPYSPSSRPIPDCLNPPNGAPASNTS